MKGASAVQSGMRHAGRIVAVAVAVIAGSLMAAELQATEIRFRSRLDARDPVVHLGDVADVSGMDRNAAETLARPNSSTPRWPTTISTGFVRRWAPTRRSTDRIS